LTLAWRLAFRLPNETTLDILAAVDLAARVRTEIRYCEVAAETIPQTCRRVADEWVSTAAARGEYPTVFVYSERSRSGQYTVYNIDPCSASVQSRAVALLSK